MSNKIMCHVVAGYPSYEECLSLLGKIDHAGVSSIEVQIPFSDPIADGETIMGANDAAVASGMTVERSFELIKVSRKHGLASDIKVMSYFQKVNSFGLEKFVNESQLCGVTGLIIPDLPYDTAEYELLNKYVKNKGVQIIPVLSPDMPSNRLQDILLSFPKTIYLTSQRGITGNSYKSNSALKKLVKEIRQKSPDSKIMLGFGISTIDDVKQAQKIADIAVVGSAVIRQIDARGVDGAVAFVKKLIQGVA